MRSTAVRLTAVLASLACGLVACGSDPRPDRADSAATASQTVPAPGTPGPSAPAPGTDAETRVAAALAGLDRRSQIAQLFVIGVPADDPDAGADLIEQGVGGLFLAGRPPESAAELADRTAGWQEQAAGPDLWVAVDQEGGSVQTLKGEGFDRLPSATVQGDLPADQLGALTADLGAQLHGAGVNLNLAPVVDVVPAGTEGTNGPIGVFDRQYGSTGAEVAPAATTFVDGLAAAGVTSTLKHFPGLGRVRGNTDDTADVVDTVTAAGDDQVTAFASTLAGTAARPMVMMSSATYSRIDPANPAAFSPLVIRDLLRGTLDFPGPVVSDDLGNAAAVKSTPVGARAVRFLSAGGTLVLTVAPDTFPTMLEAVMAQSGSDPAFAATVDAAVRTALLAKAEAGLLD
ncbi:beta-N-acetylhexosaminidase [Blastococcus aggregatus]|uniref:beta-N-acetylhexosaminidase n=1 Tax=Blastococcus aggregatus TaxID=38502 RepID=A0A285V6K3_9ACTN|nr:glycoside hydrolase family 3 N-terminal domain-containing protein [Blastococcus aggregatus]SOC49742.1 beta-N-acetylhexosaminidase [Blastococcus aggregatus]